MLQVQMIGHLGKDAEVKDINGKKMVEFSMAHTEKWMADNVQQSRTTWADCSLWNSENVAQYLKKGTQVFVQGHVSIKTWNNSANGSAMGALKINVVKLELLGSSNKNDAAGANNGAAAPETNGAAPTPGITDVPF